MYSGSPFFEQTTVHFHENRSKNLADKLIKCTLQWDEEARKELDPDTLAEKLQQEVEERYAQREEQIGKENMRHLERIILLQMVDTHWKEHLLNMDYLKEGIGLRGYGQKNPLDEYKKEGFEMFMDLIGTVKQQTISTLFRIQLVREEEVAQLEEEQRRQKQKQPMQMSHGEGEGPARRKPVEREGEKVGRNEPCPCGSGKKYKRCCGKAA